MTKLSTLIQRQSDGFPMRGVDGYGGEQSGDTVRLSGPHHFASRADADEQYPGGVPEYVDLHWADYDPGRGWTAVFGWWASMPDEGDGNPLCAN